MFQSKEELLGRLEKDADIEGQGSDRQLVIRNAPAFRGELVDTLIHTAVFAPDKGLSNLARWVIWETSQHLGSPSSSIQEFYEARAKNTYHGITVPAINIRGLTYDVARTIFRTLKRLEAAACIFEIAKSEIEYTFQRPDEYSACILAAALRENYEGPVFIQGDHVQANAKKYAQDPQKELQIIRDLVKEEVEAGFFNIDIDTSTLVDLSKATILEQQRLNFEHAAELTALIRSLEPANITISVGGEIGEVGGKNSTMAELTAYMTGYRDALKKSAAHAKGISKISIQTGTSHGGIPLPDGRVADVKLDFNCLETLSRGARERFGIAGAVQHGASTLPDDAFNRFPEAETVEVHLATGFQNLIYDHPAFPKSLKEDIYAYLRKHMADEKGDKQSDVQFIYKTRKKGFGPFKQQLWDIDASSKAAICEDLSATFHKLFRKLNIEGTRALVGQSITPCIVHRPFPKDTL